MKIATLPAYVGFFPLATMAEDDKAFKICTISGGLDVTRFVSRTTSNFFRSAIEDVELIREVISEGAINGGIAKAATLDQLANSLDWEARGLNPNDTTLTAGLAYADDRQDRRVERTVSIHPNAPFVGTKESDLALTESAATILPWLVDRRSIPTKWHLSHENGRVFPVQDEGASEQAYKAAWLLSYGETALYYPPLSAFGHPFNLGDVTGPNWNFRDHPAIAPAQPRNNPDRVATFTKPYADAVAEKTQNP